MGSRLPNNIEKLLEELINVCILYGGMEEGDEEDKNALERVNTVFKELTKALVVWKHADKN